LFAFVDLGVGLGKAGLGTAGFLEALSSLVDFGLVVLCGCVIGFFP